jgi:hypothetical protein
VRLLLSDTGGKVVALRDGRITSIDLKVSCATTKPLDPGILDLARILAT